ncbi:hypothetical protein M758_7G182100 [Ceratodon purpureus]|nr:hypothetical protein M758_7G182100 [Ceratodon purpureus]
MAYDCQKWRKDGRRIGETNLKNKNRKQRQLRRQFSKNMAYHTWLRGFSSRLAKEALIHVDVNVLGIRRVVLLGARRQRRDRQSCALGGVLGAAVAERAARSLALRSALVATAAHNGGQPAHRNRQGCAHRSAPHRPQCVESGGVERSGNHDNRRHSHSN